MDHMMSAVAGNIEKTIKPLGLMTLLNGLLTEKPRVEEESRCDHMQTENLPIYTPRS